MNPIELFVKSNDAHSPAGLFFCEKCRLVARSLQAAQQCCTNYVCSSCGTDTGGQSFTKCDACRLEDDKKLEQARFAAAEKVSAKNYDGWVYLDGTGNEGFSESIDSFLDWWSDETSDAPPAYVWACKPTAFAKIDIGDLIETIEEAGWPDFDGHYSLKGLADLDVALKKFNAANADIKSFEPDISKAVTLAVGHYYPV